MISKWMVNGNINQFVAANNVNRLGLVCFSFTTLFSLVADGGMIAAAEGGR